MKPKHARIQEKMILNFRANQENQEQQRNQERKCLYMISPKSVIIEGFDPFK